MKTKLIGGRILLEPIEQELSSGLVLPEQVNDNNPVRYGKVVQVGPGIETESGRKVPIQVEVGESVLYKHFQGMEIRIFEEEYVVLNDCDIIAIVE